MRIPYGETVDLKAEVGRLRKQIDAASKDIKSKEDKLADNTFRSRAPANIISQMEATLAERRTELAKSSQRLAQLEKGSGSPASQ